MKSLWIDSCPADEDRAPLSGVMETDTVVVGGGLAGILCAYMLKERGIDSVVVEAKRVGTGVTGHTTAKITAQHGLIYSKIEKQYGLEAAKEYLQANQEGVDIYRRLARTIACDFEEKTAYVYSRNNRKKLNDEADVYRRMGTSPVFLEKPPIPVGTVGALGMPGQAQFHPVKFLRALSRGLRIYENSFVQRIEPGKVITSQGGVHAKRIILATHFPMVNVPGLYFMKLYQHRSYVLALTGAQDPNGMYIDEQDGGLSFRTYKENLLLGGGGHPTGQEGGGWEELRRTVGRVYPGAQEQYAWATQDCISLDSIPYIGRHRENNRDIYVATGFNKWGMTGCMVAARLLSEYITEGGGRYAPLFSPSRPMLSPQLWSNMGQSARGMFSFGKRCSHMGCALKWNRQEHTWDCPCHGSRFDRKGNLIDNPAKRGIHIE